MSSDIEARLGAAVQAYQASVDDFDRELARLMGVNETDLRCLEILINGEDAAPSTLAVQLGLTSGSVTTMLDRLEKLDYLSRHPHPTDRRKTLVRITPRALERALGLMAPFLDDSRHIVAKYTPEQLELIIGFLDASRTTQDEHVQRLRAMPPQKA
ncbi:MarR family winged helix-turn-helix transcriptional regulator [Nocardia sp. NBC_01327]|uniref:MarR family winged helix-turn-helix transcriptional regulator n=1 Tax=Nocardia sp. NBC_01327 TaxID=2903593 RepID=UPI002E113918|nr:MarR family transcriptional regulator [Nocardia sp. NBC_01327]